MPSTFNVMPITGVNFATRYTDGLPESPIPFKLGQLALGDKNDSWLFVQANGTVATGTCTVGAGFQLTDAAGLYTADVAFADNEYGWVRLTASPFGFTE